MSGKTLFVDLGTNGEMILCSDGMLSGTSVAAGPAFEGGNISCGMTAKEGAIFDVEIKRGFCRCHVLGDAPACGLCGSGLFAVVNELLREGIIDERGTFVDEDHRRDGYILARVPYGKNVVITQDDIRAFQTAKAAVRAGAEALLYKVGISFSMIEQVFIAGNFGESIRPEYITGCGMLPEKVRDRISFVGNTSLEGAAKLALSPEDEPKLSEIASGVSELMIAEDEVFRELFVKRMDFERES